MSLERGYRLGKYEIEELLGAGGMGEVYLAADTELNRRVAIKFLSADFNSDDNLRNRFMQEVRSVSALNHPHILTVHDFGRLNTDDGKTLHYFVSEHVEGETLRLYLERKKLVLGDVLDILIQTASALGAAHEAGIIHRDIKPENIMIRPDGYIKILDFGLAKPVEADPTVDLEAQTKVLTNPGTVMGTVNYMSPEQARGEPVDARTDIWSLGVLFYEMITGRVPFEGETTSHTIVSILEKNPPPLAQYIQPMPEQLQFLIDELLIKNREERCQTARELLGRLKRIRQQLDTEAELDRSVEPGILRSTGGGRATPGTPSAPLVMTAVNARTTAETEGLQGTGGNLSSAEYLVGQIKRNKSIALTGLALGMVVIAGAVLAVYKFIGAGWSGEHTGGGPPIKLTRLTNDGRSFLPVISPDGKTVAFLHRANGRMSLRLRQIASNSFIDLIPEIQGNFLGAAFTPDGNDLYYVMGEKGQLMESLYKISALGGGSKKVLEDVDGPISFSPDGRRFVFLRVDPGRKRKYLITANTDGTGEQEIASRKLDEILGSTDWSPDGKTIAFTYYGQDDKGYFVYVDGYDLEKKSEFRITRERWRHIPSIAWQPDGRALLIAARDFDSAPGSPNQIWKVSFPGGQARRITNDLNDYYYLSIDAAAERLVTQITDQALELKTVRPGTNQIQRLSESLTSNVFAWTPDGELVYTSNEAGNNDLWLTDPADGTGKKQLTDDEAFEAAAGVTSKYIVYTTNRSIGWSIWRMNRDGSDSRELAGNVGFGSVQVSPDERSVYYVRNSALWKIPIEGGGKTQQITDDRVFGFRISPAGDRIAYLTRAEEPDTSLLIKIISTAGGKSLRTIDSLIKDGNFDWAPDGQAIDIVQNEGDVGNIWRVPVAGDGEPQKLTDLPEETIVSLRWSPDGRQIALTGGESRSDLVLIENFQ